MLFPVHAANGTPCNIRYRSASALFCSGVVIPETRMLGRCIDSVINVMITAVAQLALEVSPHKIQSLGGVLPCALPVPSHNVQQDLVMDNSSRFDASSTASNEDNESDEVEWDNDI